MNPQEAARRAAALKLLADLVKAEDAPARTAARDALAELGIKTLTARLDNGEEIADVTLRAGSTTANVADPDAFLTWVDTYFPGEVVTTRSVRASFQAAMLGEAKRNGVPVTATGEVIPGVEMSVGEPTLVVKLRPGCGPALMEAIRNGVIEPLALPAGAP